MSIPVLLPSSSRPDSYTSWTPKKHLLPPTAPPSDVPDTQNVDPNLKLVKKTRPRRTVDYNGGLGRWNMLRKVGYVPYVRPCPSAIIDLLPPKAYPTNPSTSLCTKFVHTSTNKIRCPVNVVTWTPESRRILTGSTSGEFTLWNGLTFNFETILQAHDTSITAFEFTHSGAYLASADKAGIIKYFEPNMNNLTAYQGSNGRDAVRAVSFSPDDRRFVTASDDRTVRVWAFEEGRTEAVLEGHGWDVKCVKWHPYKGLVVSGSKDNMIKFWDPRMDGKGCLSTVHYHKNTIQAVEWSPNGNLLASASRDQTVRIFDLRAMKEWRVLKGHKKDVCSVTWHPFHPILASGGAEGAVLHWDLSNEGEIGAGTDPADAIGVGGGVGVVTPSAALNQAHESSVWSMQFHPLGHLLVSASNDHTTRFWSRERPGEAGTGAGDSWEGEPEGEAEWDDMMVPGFGGGSGPPPGFGGDQQEEKSDFAIPGFGDSDEQQSQVPPPPPPQEMMNSWGRGDRGDRDRDRDRGGYRERDRERDSGYGQGRGNRRRGNRY